MKSSPYVGWFRHAPPVKHIRSNRSYSLRYANKNLAIQGNRVTRFQFSSKMKTSPYIGWFRHAPPSRLQLKKLSSCGHLLMDSISSTTRIKEKNHIDGRLLGGAPPYDEDNGQDGEHDPSFFPFLNDLLVDDDNKSSSSSTSSGTSSPTSATLCMLNKLASWFLFPLAHDELGSAVFGSGNDHSIYGGVSMGVSAFMMPFLSSLLRRVPLLEDGTNRSLMECHTNFEQNAHEHTTSDSEENDDVAEYSYNNSSPVTKEEDTVLNGNSSVPLEVSVSSLAEAYYAHQVSKELVEQETECPDRLQENQHQLDYVITQMDIARMVRNASRHLDVESILSLPTVTYQAKNSSAMAGSDSSPLPQDENVGHDKTNENANEEELLGGWSWMMVSSPQLDNEEADTEQDISNVDPEAKSQNINEEKLDQKQRMERQSQEEFCVICLEHFQEGDTLRVLPCGHLFHIGCIDKWLSGIHSHEECFTSGCPTCKKRPDYVFQQNDNMSVDDSSCPTDGSVPSWAFAKLGDALASESFSVSSPSHSV